MTKRLRAETDEEIDITTTASLLLLLSCEVVTAKTNDSVRRYKCKKCNRHFSSFQALGGHCTSHKKARIQFDEMHSAEPKKPRVHECVICGLKFSTGQALGGHMRRHKPAVKVLLKRQRQHEKNEELGKELLDLNAPPQGEYDIEVENQWFGGLIRAA